MATEHAPPAMVGAIETSFKASDRTYGARRVWRDVLEEGFACGLHRIERLMRLNALRARPKRRGKPKDEGERSVIADNILDREFKADRPNQKWLADFAGWLFAVVASPEVASLASVRESSVAKS